MARVEPNSILPWDAFSSKKFWTQAEILVRWWPEIVLEAQKAKPGSGFLLPAKGKEMRPL